jgi:branched-chain amino acid transport system ATP-binding protein
VIRLSEVIVRASAITKRFAGVEALSQVDWTLARGAIQGIVGPNGAGKTTMLNIISGYVTPTAGRIELDGRDITRVRPHLRVPLGIVRTFQNIRLFGGLTVLENIVLGQHRYARSGITSIWPVPTPGERRLRAEAQRLLDLFELGRYRDRRAAEIPYGSQKQLELARALAARPRVLLLDEPAAGMTAPDRAVLARRIRSVRDDGVAAEVLGADAAGITVVVVEHDMDIISQVCDTVTVLNFGRKLVEGPTEEALASPEVRTAYLGT